MKRRFFVVLAAMGLVALIVPTMSLAASKGKAIQKAPVRMSEFAFAGGSLKSAASPGTASKLKPGKTRFVFNNKGTFPHNFTIMYKSEGGSDFQSVTLDAGKKQRRTIDLRAGAYVAVCTVFNGFHASQGMIINFTVGTQNGEDGSWG